MFDQYTGYDTLMQCVPIDNGTPYALRIKFYSNDTQREWHAPDGDVFFHQGPNSIQQHTMGGCLRGETLCYIATEERPGGASYQGYVVCGTRPMPAFIRSPSQVSNGGMSNAAAGDLNRHNVTMTNLTIDLMRAMNRS
jgi:hypothetical protein